MSKTAIVVLSDPKSGGDEALGRLFNAMFLALELKNRNETVDLVFQGAGSRWPAEVVQPTHPGNALYRAVQDKVAGVSGGCATVFGAAESAEKAGLKLMRDSDIPGTGGVLDLSRYVQEGYQLMMF